MGKVPEELATESPASSTSSRLNRRGKWKKSRISSTGADNGENFETAESQNLGPQIYNSLYAASEKSKAQELEPRATTPLTPVTEAQTEQLQQTTSSSTIITTAAAPTTPEEYEVTTAKTPDASTVATTLAMVSDESATRRMDTAVDGDGEVEVEDLDTQPSIFSEVRQQLHDLFAIDENDDEAATAALAAVGKRRQEYTSIKRTPRPTPTSTTETSTTEAAELGGLEGMSLTTAATHAEQDNFHKDLMEHVVYATSTSTKVTSETEICYRGRCIRSEDLPANHKLH